MICGHQINLSEKFRNEITLNLVEKLLNSKNSIWTVMFNIY